MKTEQTIKRQFGTVIDLAKKGKYNDPRIGKWLLETGGRLVFLLDLNGDPDRDDFVQ